MERAALVASLLGLLSCSAMSSRARWIPDAGFVPDARTAVAIAEAVWIPIYGEKTIAAERPFRANLEDDIWLVTGSVECPSGGLCVGGSAFAKISRRDGTVLEVTHYQ